MKSSADALEGQPGSIRQWHARCAPATECGSHNDTMASKRGITPNSDDCTLLPVQTSQGVEGPSPAEAQGPKCLTGRRRSTGQPEAILCCSTWRGVRLMGWLLLHRPVGPALPLNSILQARICLHQPLLICCSPGPGSCQALHLPARPGTHKSSQLPVMCPAAKLQPA